MRGRKPKRESVKWSSDLAYGVGLMVSDGNLSSDGRHLECTSKDKEQMENLRKCFDITAKISTKKSGRENDKNVYYRVQWGDVVLYQFLLDIGLTPNKSLTIGKIEVPDEYFFDFVRGIHDGDGCFYSYYDSRWKNSFMFYLIFVSASKKHLTWLRGNLKRLAGVNGHETAAKGRSFFQLRYAKQESLVLLEKMYEDPSGVTLKRKKLKIKHSLAIVGRSLPTPMPR